MAEPCNARSSSRSLALAAAAIAATAVAGREHGGDRPPHRLPRHSVGSAEGVHAHAAIRRAAPFPIRRTACRKLQALGKAAFAPTPHDRVCTQIAGPPVTAVVTGTFQGRRIWARLTQHDGCADRALEPRLVPAAAVEERQAHQQLSVALSSIARCEDRPLRRRRAPPAARDHAGARPGHSRRRRRPQPRRARVSGRRHRGGGRLHRHRRSDRGRPAARGRRRADRLRRQRRSRRRGGDRAPRPAHDRHERGAADAQQDRDATRVRGRRRAAATVRRACDRSRRGGAR